MSSCVIPVLERFKGRNKSARVRSRKAANRETAQASATMVPDTVRMMMPRSSSVPPEPRSRRGIALEPEEEERDVGIPLPQRDARGFTIFRSGLSVRHDNPTLGLGDAAYQRQHQAHRMNVEQYQELQRQLSSSERASTPQRGVMSLGLPDNLRPGTLFRRIRNDLDNGNSSSNLDSSNSSSDRRSSLPRRTKKLPSTFSAESHFYSSLKRGGSFSSGRGSDSTSCSSLEPAAGNGMAVAAFIPPANGPMGRRPPSYLLPKALSPCPPAKMHPFIPNLGRTLQQQQPATVDRKGRPGSRNAVQSRKQREIKTSLL